MSSSLIDPLKYANAWDVILVGNAVSPGYCVLSGFDRTAEFDVKKGKGTKGATITFVQRPLVEGEIEFFLWDNGTLGTGHNHFEEWASFMPLLKYDPTKKKIQAIPIFHPALADLEITSVICRKIGPLKRTHELMFSSHCEFFEYTPPPKTAAVGTASGTRTQGYAGAAAKAQAAAEAAAQAAAQDRAEPNALQSQGQTFDQLMKQYTSDAPT